MNRKFGMIWTGSAALMNLAFLAFTDCSVPLQAGCFVVNTLCFVYWVRR